MRIVHYVKRKDGRYLAYFPAKTEMWLSQNDKEYYDWDGNYYTAQEFYSKFKGMGLINIDDIVVQEQDPEEE